MTASNMASQSGAFASPHMRGDQGRRILTKTSPAYEVLLCYCILLLTLQRLVPGRYSNCYFAQASGTFTYDRPTVVLSYATVKFYKTILAPTSVEFSLQRRGANCLTLRKCTER